MIATLLASLALGALPTQEASAPRTVTVTEYQRPYRYLDTLPRGARIDVSDRQLASLRAANRSRLRLADTLDRLIASGDCDGAKQAAVASGWTDIVGEVERVCQVRRSN